MGNPEPAEPKPSDDSDANTADWLVGAEEGLAAEMARGRPDGADVARPTLLRPGASTAPASSTPFAPDAAPDPECAAAPPGTAPPAPRKRFGAVMPDLESGSDFVQGPAMTWEPGTRSVPSIRREARSAPAPTREFPMDDAVERSRERSEEIQFAMADALAAANSHEVVSPDAFNIETVQMPWWIQFAHTTRTDRRLQALVLVSAVALSAIALWPRGEQPTSVGRIRHHSDRYDGASVRVAGRVGQVFTVGGGHAFYLIDGGDTLVVFTRTRAPRERQHVRVGGTMSVGWLDGQPTLALFESVDGKR